MFEAGVHAADDAADALRREMCAPGYLGLAEAAAPEKKDEQVAGIDILGVARWGEDPFGRDLRDFDHQGENAVEGFRFG